MGPTGSARKRPPPDYYALLDIAPGSSFRAIEAAYWARVTNDEYRNQIALLNEAYEVLSHSQRRAQYDAQRPAPAEREPDAEPEDSQPRWGNPGLRRKLRW